jgi:hypothetical protein
MAGERRLDHAGGQARPMHVDDAVEHCGTVANLAGDGLSAYGPEAELICWHTLTRARNARAAASGPATIQYPLDKHQGSVNPNFPLIPGLAVGHRIP